MGDDVSCNKIQKHVEQTVLQNCLHDEDKGVRVQGGDHFLFLDWVLFRTIHTKQMKLSWKLTNDSKKFYQSFIKCVGDMNIEP